MNALPIPISCALLLAGLVGGHGRVAAGQEAAPPPTDAQPPPQLAEQESPPPRDEPPADPQQKFGVYRLKYAEAQEAANTVAEVLGGLKGLRIAVDSRTNSLLVYATDEQGKIIGNLLQVLDTPEKRSEPEEADAAARQERRLVIYWLASGRDFESEKRMPQQLHPVVEELGQLGIENLQLVSTSVVALDGTNVSFNNSVSAGRRGFDLSVDGRLSPGLGGEEQPKIHLTVRAKHSQATESAHVQTWVTTPYNHFVVLGVTGLADLENAFVLQLQRFETTPSGTTVR